MTVQEFIEKWSASELSERAGSHLQFIELCKILDEPPPGTGDPTSNEYCFEKRVHKDRGGKGWADVWKRGCFAWEYKGPGKDLNAAFDQLRQYALALENPPLLIVSDMKLFRIHTNWTNSVSKVYEFSLEDLADSTYREMLKWAMSDPKRLRPEATRQELTDKAAQTFAKLARNMRGRGNDPKEVAHFINRLVFCMFAEDVGLLPTEKFTGLMKYVHKYPEDFVGAVGELFRAMASGGRFGDSRIDWFNGGLFDDDATLPLEKSEIATVLETARLDWGEIDPAILGTLFVQGLDPESRSAQGSHYTDREKIMQIVDPVIVRPLRKEWEEAKAKIAQCLDQADREKASKKRGFRAKANGHLQAYLDRLRNFTVLDPACGSGNFLYLALNELKDLEYLAQLEAGSLGLQTGFPAVGPINVRGIEKNPYAAELARVSIWIGEIQWMRRNGFSGKRKPILTPLDTIECRDAIINDDGTEADWPEADVVIGNPPFLGGKRLRRELGETYVASLQRLYGSRIHGEADFVCHWFDKAWRLLSEGKIVRAGLVATNSIRGGRNRAVLDRILGNGSIYCAWSDEPWVVDGAAVRVALVCFTEKDADLDIRLNGKNVLRINADLTGETVDLTRAVQLARNAGIAFMGVTKAGPFEISGDLAREWLCLPANPNGRKNADVLSPWLNGKDTVNRPSGDWIIDFGFSIDEAEGAFYERPFTHLAKTVKPIRQLSSNEKDRKLWWRHTRSRPRMRKAISCLSRYIVTPTTSKHRIFVWVDLRICPENALIVFARDDDTIFGILHSRYHETWSLRLGTSLEDRPRYTPITTFQTFPFPEGLTPDIPASEYADDPRAVAIAEAAKRLMDERYRWLYPPQWVKWVEEPVAGYPKRPMPIDETAAEFLKDRTLTRLYNCPPQWLINAHAALDNTVASAYGWPTDISNENALGELLRMNLDQGIK